MLKSKGKIEVYVGTGTMAGLKKLAKKGGYTPEATAYLILKAYFDKKSKPNSRS